MEHEVGSSSKLEFLQNGPDGHALLLGPDFEEVTAIARQTPDGRAPEAASLGWQTRAPILVNTSAQAGDGPARAGARTSRASPAAMVPNSMPITIVVATQ